MTYAASDDGNRARGYRVAPTFVGVAPTEAGMGMRCWIMLVIVIVASCRGQGRLLGTGTIQPPVGTTYGVQTERVFVHLEYLAPGMRLNDKNEENDSAALPFKS